METSLNFINKFDKEYVYKIYILTNFAEKDYEKITRSKMLKVIYDTINLDQEWLGRYISFDALNILKELSFNSGINIKDEKLKVFIDELVNKFLLVYDEENGIYIIPSQIVETVKTYELSEELLLINEFYWFIMGVLMTKGSINLFELENIYDSLRPNHMYFDFLAEIYNLTRLLMEIDINQLEFKNNLYLEDFFNYKDVDTTYQTKANYDFSTYQSFGLLGYNLKNEVHNEVASLLKRHYTNDEIHSIFKKLIMFMQNEEYDELEKLLYVSMKLDDSIDYKLIVEKLKNELPIWEYGGDSYKDLTNEFNEVVNNDTPYTDYYRINYIN